MAGPSSCFAAVSADFCSLCGAQLLQLQCQSQREAEPRSAPVFLFLLAGPSHRTLMALPSGRRPGVWALDGDAALQEEFGLALDSLS